MDVAASLIVPGLGGSGPEHWQTWWQTQVPDAVRVEQADWHTPDLERWARRVGAALEQTGEPAWLVAHSFGCLAAVHAALARPGRVAGAFLVAPADPARFGLDTVLPATALPFPALLIASEDDPWMSLPRAHEWAGRWGCACLSLGRAGHINVEAGYGPWPQGLGLFASLQAADTHQHRPAQHRIAQI